MILKQFPFDFVELIKKGFKLMFYLFFGINLILSLLFYKLNMSSLKHSKFFFRSFWNHSIPFLKFTNEKFWKVWNNSMYSFLTCTFLIFSIFKCNIKPMNSLLVCNKTWNFRAYKTTFKYNTFKIICFYIFLKTNFAGDK